MAVTPKRALWYPTRADAATFPDGFAGNELGENGILRRMQDSVEAAFDTTGWVKIAEYTNTVDENSSTFSDIPDDFENLILEWEGRSEDAATTWASLLIRLNGDSGATNYYSGRWGIRPGNPPTFQEGTTYGANGQASVGIVGEQASSGYVFIPRYTRSITKRIHGIGAASNSVGTSGSDMIEHHGIGVWQSTTVTSIRWWPSSLNWATGMRAVLYGTPKVE